MSEKALKRCSWPSSELDILYHDTEWGVPVHDDRVFFEFLTLEGAQAGLSWSTILKKREGYREAFAGFDPVAVSRFGEADVERLVLNPAVVRHRQKIASVVGNARAFLRVQEEHGSFDAWVWGFVGGRPRVNRRRGHGDIPARTAESDALSKELMRRGFRFAGSTICQAFMQATGMVNDHVISCFRHGEIGKAGLGMEVLKPPGKGSLETAVGMEVSKLQPHRDDKR
ncbi:MAG TPA: DNA-3-methyladenine glycosylase I [Gemmatimonadaceae bacterium]|nr:DNA-3-methyladenine glycosylase I [Gemmatimonadaceae bacterium]